MQKKRVAMKISFFCGTHAPLNYEVSYMPSLTNMTIIHSKQWGVYDKNMITSVLNPRKKHNSTDVVLCYNIIA